MRPSAVAIPFDALDDNYNGFGSQTLTRPMLEASDRNAPTPRRTCTTTWNPAVDAFAIAYSIWLQSGVCS